MNLINQKRFASLMLITLFLTLIVACTPVDGQSTADDLDPTVGAGTDRIEEDMPPAVEGDDQTAVSPLPADEINLQEAIINKDWDLVEYGPEGATHSPLPGATATIQFGDGEFSGVTGCNSYFGQYELNGNTLLTKGGGNTEMWCEGVMEQETAVLRLLQNAEKLSLENALLTIQSSEGILVFKAAEQTQLEGVLWRLSSIVQGDAVVSTAIDRDITIKFIAGEVAGSSGCNQYSSSYEMENNQLTFGLFASTLMACEGERGAREVAFLTALAAVQGYEITRNNLTLLDADGSPLLTFVANTAVEN